MKTHSSKGYIAKTYSANALQYGLNAPVFGPNSHLYPAKFTIRWSRMPSFSVGNAQLYWLKFLYLQSKAVFPCKQNSLRAKRTDGCLWMRYLRVIKCSALTMPVNVHLHVRSSARSCIVHVFCDRSGLSCWWANILYYSRIRENAQWAAQK